MIVIIHVRFDQITELRNIMSYQFQVMLCFTTKKNTELAKKARDLRMAGEINST